MPKDFQNAGIEFKIEFSRVDNGFFQKETKSFDVFFDNNFFFSDNVGGALLFFQGDSVSLLKDNKRIKGIFIFLTPMVEIILMSFISPQDMLQYYENLTHIQKVYVRVHCLEEERKNSLLKAFSPMQKKNIYIYIYMPKNQQFSLQFV